jgi:hypothetical protein
VISSFAFPFYYPWYSYPSYYDYYPYGYGYPYSYGYPYGSSYSYGYGAPYGSSYYSGGVYGDDSGYYGDSAYYGGPSYGNRSAGDSSTVTKVQRVLAQEGYYKGDIDGDLGPRTHYAINAYQRDHNLSVTGTINGELLESMGLR